MKIIYTEASVIEHSQEKNIIFQTMIVVVSCMHLNFVHLPGMVQ